MPNPTRTVNGETREWDGNSWVPVNAPSGVPMHHPGLSESPTDAAVSEGMRTAGEAAMGVVRSPWDALKGLVGLPMTAVKGLSEIPAGLEALTDPSTYRGMIPAAKEGIKELGDNPREAGSLLGQLLLGKVVGPEVPGAARTALEEGPGVVGRGVSKVGRGVEAVGASPLTKRAGMFAGAADVIRGDPKGALIMAAPKTLEMAGRGIQKIGGGIEGLKLAADKPVPPTPPSVVNGLTLSKEALGRNIDATNMVADGFSPAQAGKLSGIPGAGKSKLVSRISHLPQIPENNVQDVLDGMALPQKDYAISPDENEQVSLNRLRAAGRPDGASAYADWAKKPVEDPSSSYDASTELDPKAINAGYDRNNPLFKQMQGTGMFGGDRTAPTVPAIDKPTLPSSTYAPDLEYAPVGGESSLNELRGLLDRIRKGQP